MSVEVAGRIVLVSLPEGVIEALLKIHALLDAGLADALQRPTAAPCGRSSGLDREASPRAIVNAPARKYVAEFLGVRITAWTLPELFAGLVDLTADVAPEALDKLAAMRARRRRFVARSREAIHPGRQDLGVMRTASGWWISRNIGQADLKRALQALARAAGLGFGEDVRFPAA